MAGPFGSAPVVDPYAGRPDKKKWYETFGETLAPALLQMANLAGSKAMDYGLEHAQTTHRAQAQDFVNAQEHGRKVGDEAAATDASIRALADQGRTLANLPPDLSGPIGAKPAVAPAVAPKPAAAVPPTLTGMAQDAGTKVESLVNSVPNFGPKPELKSASVSTKGGTTYGGGNAFTDAGKRLAETTLPMVEEGALAGQNAARQGRVAQYGQDETARRAAAMPPPENAATFYGYEAEYFKNVGKKADADNMAQRTAAVRYAEGKMRSDPRYTEQQALAKSAASYAQLAKDKASEYKAYAEGVNAGGNNLAAMANKAQEEEAAAWRLSFQKQRQGLDKGMSLEEYNRQVKELTDDYRNAENPNTQKVIMAQIAWLGEQAQRYGYPVHVGDEKGDVPTAKGLVGPGALKDRDAVRKANETRANLLTRLEAQARIAAERNESQAYRDGIAQDINLMRGLASLTPTPANLAKVDEVVARVESSIAAREGR